MRYKIIINFFIILTVLSLVNACAILPYENDYSCRLKDNYGKCMSVDAAYQEALAGQSQGKPLVPKSQQNRQGRVPNSVPNYVPNLNAVPVSAPYHDYQARNYQTLSRLIDQPKTAMLKPPTTVRTLILAYAPDDQKGTLFMPRYVYSIVDEPQWILGQYLNKTPTLTKSLVDQPELKS